MTAQPPSSHRIHFSVVLGALALFISLSGCAYIGGAIALAVSGGSSSSTRAANQEPSVNFVVTPIPQPADLVATVDYVLLDLESNPIDITIDFSTDNGSTWAVAMEGPGGDGTQDVSSSAAGTPHVYAWDFFSDLFSSDFTLLQTSSFGVTLRFTSDDGVTRATPLPQDTVSFRVGNFAPIVSLGSITSTPLDSSAEIRYTLIDDFSDPLDLLIEFSLDDFATVGQVATQLVPPSLGCPDGITGLVSSPAGDLHCFEWDFPADLLTAAEDVKVRLTATDSAMAASNQATSSPFRVGNDAPILLPGAVDTQFGVSVDFTLLDSTNDTVSIFVEYSLDDGITYLPAVNLVGSVAGLAASDQGTSHNIAWNALPDVGIGTFNTVLLQITPTDEYGAIGAARATNTFSLVNTDRPFVFISSPKANDLVAGPVTVDYLLVDFDSDPMVAILVEYRAAGSPTFVAVTEGTGGDGTTNLTTSPAGASHTFVWDTSIDLPNQDVSDAEVRITPTDTTGVGTAALGGPYRVDNNVEPTIQNISTPASPATQDIAITYDIVDPEGDSVDILVQFSTDGGVTFPDHAHQPASGSDGIRGLSSSPGGTTHFFAWDSLRDLGPVTENMVALRITPMDNPDPALGLGIQDATATFTVDNFPSTAPPTIDTISPSQGPSAGLNPAIVTGTGFLSGTTVTIGTQPLQGLSIVSTDTITGNIPTYVGGPVSVDVTVDNGNGTATLTGGYTYVVGPTILSVTPNQGVLAGMDLVSIDTLNFSDDFMASPPASVTFGGVPATNLMGTGPSTFNVTSPAGVMSGFVNVFVQGQSGDQATLTNGFEYLAPPPCMIAMISPTLGPIGGGTTVTIDGSNFRPGAPLPTITFGGVPATVDPTTTDIQIICTTGAFTGLATVDVDITNSMGNMCTSVGGYTYDVVGVLDTSFGAIPGFFLHDGAAGGAGFDKATSVVLDGSGRIVTAGWSRGVANTDMAVWRINPDGTLDTTFNGQGFFFHDNAAGGNNTDQAHDVALDGSGRILVTGLSWNGANFDMATWRLNVDGTLDTTFNTVGFLFHNGAAGGNGWDTGYAILGDSMGRIVVAGKSLGAGTGDDATVWRFNADGTFDTTFNTVGWVSHDLPSSGNDVPNGMAIDGSGRILLVGTARDVSTNDLAIWRFTTAGALDTTFNGLGWVTHDGAGGGGAMAEEGRAITFDSTGRILATGVGANVTGLDEMVLWAYNPDGTLDTTFNGQGWVNHAIADCTPTLRNEGTGIVVDGLDRIVVTGWSNCGASGFDLAIWRIDSAGNFDSSFNGQGWTNSSILGCDESYGVALDGAGKIIVTGTADGPTGGDMAVWRFNTDGTLDTSLNPGPGFVTHNDAGGGDSDDFGHAVAIDPGGRILATGISWSPINEDMALYAFNPDGTLDLGFNGQGFVVHDNAAGGTADDSASGIAVEPGGRIFVVGRSDGNLRDMAIWAYMPDGTLDLGFGTGGIVIEDNTAGGNGDDKANGVYVGPAGRVLVSGSSDALSGSDMVVWAYDPMGVPDLGFGTGGVFMHDSAAGGGDSDEGGGITMDSANRILVAGSSLDATLDKDMVLWRLNPNGTLDTAFNGQGWVVHDNAGGGLGGDKGSEVVVEVSGRILVCGSSLGVNGDDMVVWAFNPDGSLDTTWNGQGWVTHDNAAGGSGLDAGKDIGLDALGRIVVSGESRGAVTTGDMAVWRFTPSGVLDITFGLGGFVIHDGAAGVTNSLDRGNDFTFDSAGRIVVFGDSVNAALNRDVTVWRYQ